MFLFSLGIALFLFASPPASQGALNEEHPRSGTPTPLSQNLSQRTETFPEIPEGPWGTFFLTPEEKAWLEELPPLLLGVDPAWPPMEFCGQPGSAQGHQLQLRGSPEESFGYRHPTRILSKLGKDPGGRQRRQR